MARCKAMHTEINQDHTHHNYPYNYPFHTRGSGRNRPYWKYNFKDSGRACVNELYLNIDSRSRLPKYSGLRKLSAFDVYGEQWSLAVPANIAEKLKKNGFLSVFAKIAIANNCAAENLFLHLCTDVINHLDGNCLSYYTGIALFVKDGMEPINLFY